MRRETLRSVRACGRPSHGRVRLVRHHGVAPAGRPGEQALAANVGPRVRWTRLIVCNPGRGRIAVFPGFPVFPRGPLVRSDRASQPSSSDGRRVHLVGAPSRAVARALVYQVPIGQQGKRNLDATLQYLTKNEGKSDIVLYVVYVK